MKEENTGQTRAIRSAYVILMVKPFGKQQFARVKIR
jgi:hypothetical protein